MGAIHQQSPDPGNGKRAIPTLVKDEGLVAEKRRQIVEAVVPLFCAQGFHQTTTRQMAAAAGMSIGALYEYVKNKEDVLYLVCESIHAEMEARLREVIDDTASARDCLERAIAGYFHACDRMQDSILLIYQESKSLTEESRRYVLANDERIANYFVGILERGREDGSLSSEEGSVALMAHNITVLGHMWAFRRWSLKPQYTLDEYTCAQTALLMNELGIDSQ